MMSFTNDNDRNLWIDSEIGTSLCPKMSVAQLYVHKTKAYFLVTGALRSVNKGQNIARNIAYLDQALA